MPRIPQEWKVKRAAAKKAAFEALFDELKPKTTKKKFVEMALRSRLSVNLFSEVARIAAETPDISGVDLARKAGTSARVTSYVCRAMNYAKGSAGASPGREPVLADVDENEFATAFLNVYCSPAQVGYILRGLLRHSDVSLKKVADRLDVSPATVARIAAVLSQLNRANTDSKIQRRAELKRDRLRKLYRKLVKEGLVKTEVKE